MMLQEEKESLFWNKKNQEILTIQFFQLLDRTTLQRLLREVSEALHPEKKTLKEFLQIPVKNQEVRKRVLITKTYKRRELKMIQP